MGQASEEVIASAVQVGKHLQNKISRNRRARARTPGDRRRIQTEAQPAARKAQTENNNNDAADSLWKQAGCVAGKAAMEKGSSQQRRADGRIGGKGRAGRDRRERVTAKAGGTTQG